MAEEQTGEARRETDAKRQSENKGKNWWRKYTKKHLEEPAEEASPSAPQSPAQRESPRQELREAPEVDMTNPFGELNTMQNQLDSILKNMFSRDIFRFPEMSATLKMDEGLFRKPRSSVHESEKEVFVTLKMPGVNKDNIKIKIDGPNLIIDAQTKSENKKELKGIFSTSSSYQGFRNIIRLPCAVIKEKAKADYDHGILKITLPKKEASEGPSDIPIE